MENHGRNESAAVKTDVAPVVFFGICRGREHSHAQSDCQNLHFTKHAISIALFRIQSGLVFQKIPKKQKKRLKKPLCIYKYVYEFSTRALKPLNRARRAALDGHVAHLVLVVDNDSDACEVAEPLTGGRFVQLEVDLLLGGKCGQGHQDLVM